MATRIHPVLLGGCFFLMFRWFALGVVPGYKPWVEFLGPSGQRQQSLHTSARRRKEEWKGQLLLRILKALKCCQLRNELCCCPIILLPSLVHWLCGIRAQRETNDSWAEIWKSTFRTVGQILTLNMLRSILLPFLEASLCVLSTLFKCFYKKVT